MVVVAAVVVATATTTTTTGAVNGRTGSDRTSEVKNFARVVFGGCAGCLLLSL